MAALRPPMIAQLGQAVLLPAVLGLFATFASAQNESKPTTPPAEAAPATQQGPQAAVGPNRVELMRTALAKWVDVSKSIAKRKNEWKTGKTLLSNRIELVKREIQTDEERADESNQRLGEITKETEGLRTEEAELKAGTKILDEQVVVYEERLLKLMPRLPSPLRSKVAPVFQQIPTSPDDVEKRKLSLGQRFVNLLTVLKEIHKFNGEPTVENETLAFGDKNYNVAVIYFGISQGYYVSKDKKVFGFGSSTVDGWQWRESKRPEDADLITQAIAIAQNESPATFVPLPVVIQEGAK